MRDPDALQAKEADQQRFVEEIERSLQEATHEDDLYRSIFLHVAVDILDTLKFRGPPQTRDSTDAALMLRLVWEPIRARTKDEAERRYLLLKVFEKVFGSVSAGIISEYNSKELAENQKPAPVS